MNAGIKGAVYVIKDGYYVREAPNKRSDAVMQPHDGMMLVWLGFSQKGWLKVTTDCGTGWIPSRAIILMNDILLVNKPTAAMRISASSFAKRVDNCLWGTKLFDLKETIKGWRKVMNSSGKVGWVREKAIAKE